MMVDLMTRARDPWFDDARTPQVEGRDDMVRRSFKRAVRWLEEKLGNDPARWQWGKLHTVILAHRPIGESGIPILSRLFNVGPLAAGGDRYSVNAAWFSLADPDRPYAMDGGAAHRFLADLADWDRSLGVENSGQSEHLFHPHRDDLVPLWQRVAYHRVPFSRQRVRAAAASVLTLEPSRRSQD
jgi:penicillin amidase